MAKSLSIHITGKVQGVFFRKYTKEKAIELGLKGFVQNESDGSVLAHATGDEATLNDFINWCREGSPKSKVDKVEVTALPLTSFDRFEIRHSY